MSCCVLPSGANAAVLVWSGLVLSTARVFVTGCALPHDRDSEKAYVTVNDKVCWTQDFSSHHGSRQCGSKRRDWDEKSSTVQCQGESISGKLTVIVYTDLNSHANDESFAIDNVEVTQISTGTVIRSTEPLSSQCSDWCNGHR